MDGQAAGGMTVVLGDWVGRVRMLQRTDEQGSRQLLIEEADVGGATVELVAYARHELFGAVDDYVPRLPRMLEQPAARAAEVALTMTAANGRRDVRALVQILADDFQLIDHRPLGLGQLDRNSYLAMVEANADTQSRYLPSKLHRASPNGFVASGSFWTLSYGDWYEVQVGEYVTRTIGDRLQRIEIYPEGSVAEALARSDEPDAASHPT